MDTHRNKSFNVHAGFTLVELLVVIAIIGILSAVVLASLNTARQKGGDAAVQADLNAIRIQAEIFYGNNTNSYNTGSTISSPACSTLTTAGSLFSDTNIQSALKGARGASGNDSDCGATATAYSIAAPLVTSSTGAWCIDSTGVSRNKTAGGTIYTALTGSVTAAHLASGATVCQ